MLSNKYPGLISGDDTAVRFLGDTGDDTTGVHIGDSADLNVTNGPWYEKSIVVWFQADDVDPDETQMIFEEGGSTRGLNVYVFEGEVYIGAWNRGGGDGPGSPWISGDDDPEGGNIYLHTPIESGEIYQVAMVMDGDDSDNFEGTLTGYLNGQEFAQTDGVGLLYNHGDDAGIGHVHQNTYLQHENWNNGNGLYFEGVIDELSLYKHGPFRRSNRSAVGSWRWRRHCRSTSTWRCRPGLGL